MAVAGNLVRRIARDGERLTEVKPYPFGANGATREQCPVCADWFGMRTDGMLRIHGPRSARCAGSGVEDERPHVVVSPAPPGGVMAVYRLTGRRNAEVIANQQRRAGLEPIVYLLEATS